VIVIVERNRWPPTLGPSAENQTFISSPGENHIEAAQIRLPVIVEDRLDGTLDMVLRQQISQAKLRSMCGKETNRPYIILLLGGLREGECEEKESFYSKSNRLILRLEHVEKIAVGGPGKVKEQTKSDGTQKIYKKRNYKGDFSKLPEENLRRMDCIDCHNRPRTFIIPPINQLILLCHSAKLTKLFLI
jgi:hypothetical protein